MAEASVLRLARTRPLLFAVLETLLTGACALVWFAFAGLLHLEDGTHEGGDPTRLPAGAFALAAGVAAASLVLTWVLCAEPGPAADRGPADPVPRGGRARGRRRCARVRRPVLNAAGLPTY
ncbi:hypothetical protein ACFVOK_11250 [Streptomyces sp. NPDC057798]|uniref:hypothetical protein n=1 Tax=Streptomyces sp. NPDC057798 TaxID=3346252 RepID=UPI00369FCE81